MNLTERQRHVLFQMLCAYRHYKHLYPEVILNYHRRDPGVPDPGRIEDVFDRFREQPDESNFTAVFDLLKAIDRSIEGGTAVRQYVLDDGVLLVGDSFWSAFSLIPGEYPFARLRFIHLRGDEVVAYRQTPTVTFPAVEALNVATCSLGAVAHTRFGGAPNLRGDEYGLVAREVSPAPALAKKIESCLSWAQQKQADVVLFPELSIDQPGLDVVESWIGRNAGQAGVPGVIVAGSFYLKVEGSYRNRATIYLTGQDDPSGRGFHKLHYDKNVPFSMTVPGDPSKMPESDWKTIFEAAQSAGKKVVVEDFVSGGGIALVNTSKGMLGFAICRDALDLAGVGNPLERYLNFVDHLMIISFNEGVTNLFEAQGEDLARWHNCAVAYMNAGQSVGPTNDVVKMAYCIYPYDRASSGIGGKIYYRKAPEAGWGHLGIEALPASGNVLHALEKTS